MGCPEKNISLIKAYIRQRPFTHQEHASKSASIIKEATPTELTVGKGSVEKKFVFDQIFAADVSQEEVYEVVVSPLIPSVIMGYNCSVFAYGPTGTGKTYTMYGDFIDAKLHVTDSSNGLIPRVAFRIFSELSVLIKKLNFTVRVSFLEVYNEEVRDLLKENNTQLKVYDDPENRGSTCIKGLTEATVYTPHDVIEWLQIGNMVRHTGATNINRNSSRSHTIFTFQVHSQAGDTINTGKMHLIDLAGSENISRSGATEMRAREAGTINKSLLALAKVIKSLAQNNGHTPYRDSKLTRILQDSLGGNAKTSLIATCAPSIQDWDETISTLEYARMAKSVANRPVININKKQQQLINELQQDILKLKRELSSTEDTYVCAERYYKTAAVIERKAVRIKELNKELERITELKELKDKEIADLKESFRKTREHLGPLKEKCEELTQEFEEREKIRIALEKKIEKLKKFHNEVNEASTTTYNNSVIIRDKYDNQYQVTDSNIYTTKLLSNPITSAYKQLQYLTNQSEEDIKNNYTSALETLDELIGSRMVNICELLKNNEIGINQTPIDLNQFKLSVSLTEETLAAEFNKTEKALEDASNLAVSSFENVQKLLDDTKTLIENQMKAETEFFTDQKYYSNRMSEQLPYLREQIQRQDEETQRLKNFVENFTPIVHENDVDWDLLKSTVDSLYKCDINGQFKQDFEEKLVLIQEEVDNDNTALEKADEAIVKKASDFKTWYENETSINNERYKQYIEDLKSEEHNYREKTRELCVEQLVTQEEHIAGCTLECTTNLNRAIEKTLEECQRLTVIQSRYSNNFNHQLIDTEEQLNRIKKELLPELKPGSTPERPIRFKSYK